MGGPETVVFDPTVSDREWTVQFMMRLSMPRLRDQITDEATLLAFLSTGVRENAVLDYKRDFPKTLEKTLAAFANTYGGTVLIGVEETETGAAKLPVVGVPLESGLRERVHQIALDAITPPLLPTVEVITVSGHSEAEERAVVVVTVDESDQAPHAVEGGTAVYLRADNVSRRERVATVGEIEWLTNKRAKSESERNRISSLLHQHANVFRDRRKAAAAEAPLRPLAHKSHVDLMLMPQFPRQPLATPRELRVAANGAQLTGLNVAVHDLPGWQWSPVAEGVCFTYAYGSSEFQQQGAMLHTWDFWWDEMPGPSTSAGRRDILPAVPATMLWAVLTLAGRLYSKFGFPGYLTLELTMTSTRDSIFRDRKDLYNPAVPIVDDLVEVTRTIRAADLPAAARNIARDCQRELYWACGIDASEEILNRDFSAVPKHP